MRVDVTRVVKCRKGLSIAVMTLILLVISILLALIAMLYALNMTTGGLPMEGLAVSKYHIWQNSTDGWFEAALVVTNIGETSVVLDKITVRSIPREWSDIYYWKTNTVAITSDPNVTSSQLSGPSYTIIVMGEQRNFTRASDDLTLKSGWTLVLYIKNPVFSWEPGGRGTIKVHTAIRPYPVNCDFEKA